MKEETSVESTARQGKASPPSSPDDASASSRAGRNVPSESMIDQTLEQSFPASDPPSWTLGI